VQTDITGNNLEQEKENLKLKVKRLEENDSHLNEQLNKEIDRNNELSEQVTDLEEKIQQAQNKIEKLTSLNKKI